MSDGLAALPNIGPKTAAMLRAVGIASPADLRAVGAVAAYRRLRFRYPETISLNALWALHGALTGTPWTELDRAEKDRLKAALPS